MIKVFILAVMAVTIAGASESAPPRIISMQELTVPSERLPVGCRLSPAPTAHLDGGRVRAGLWAEFPTNPWLGADRRLLASIRQQVDGPAAVPDGPPLDPKALSRYLGQLADDVEEGYGAVYIQSARDLITVRALRFAPAEKVTADSSSSGARVVRNPAVIRVTIGPIVAIVSGDGGACFQVVGEYLKSLVD
jgi:hypothetical protein